MFCSCPKTQIDRTALMEAVRLQYVNLEQDQNHKEHRTEGLNSGSLVVRRGQPFRLTLGFSEPYKSNIVGLRLGAELDGLCFDIPVIPSKESAQGKWAAYLQQDALESISPCKALVWVVIPATASVGVYQLKLQLSSRAGSCGQRVGQFTVLCNPWCSADSVWLPDERMREEYVMNDFGLLYHGTDENITFRPWSFDQYERGVLDICLMLLQVSNEHKVNWRTDYTKRSDPVYISRVVSAMINCNDDCGVLEGNWSEDQMGGVAPSAWTGSGDILRQWAQSHFRPVKYGQCWVFAGVMCTVMRALGIPSRVVTCFNSAHDTNGNLVIEEYYNEAGEKLPQSRDSIWNFHLWVECWMKRGDLEAGFDGWQVVDPTPQEKSSGSYRCGPAPVRAVRECRIQMPHDVPFIYAEVNADVSVSIVCQGQVVSCTKDTERVGNVICTKSLGSNQPQDITMTYKHKVAQPNEKNRSLGAGLSVGLDLLKEPVTGESITFSVTITNEDNVRKSVKEYVNAQGKSYNHSPAYTLWEAQNLIQLAPRERKVLTHQISSDQQAAMRGNHLINLAVVLADVASQERVLASKEFNISRPAIKIRIVNKDIIAGVCQVAMVTFTNPLLVPVSGLMMVAGAGLLEDKAIIRVLMKPRETMEWEVIFTPNMPGVKMLHASLRMDKGPAVQGFKTITVLPAPDTELRH